MRYVMKYLVIEKQGCLEGHRKSAFKKGKVELINKTFRSKKSLYNALFVELFFRSTGTSLDNAERYFDIYQIDNDIRTPFHPTQDEFLSLCVN